MMDDAPSGYYPEDQEPQSRTMRWIAFVFILVLGVVSFYGLVTTSALENMLFIIIIFGPVLLFFIYAAYRWAQGRDIVHTNQDEDDQLLDEMWHHALPAERVSGLEMYRCPDCGMSFELVNATPVEERVVLCPICGVRLYIK
jgi:DNA-directed RNA polymerase subunit RPC12/RpoP